jgi:hypothetical protein
VAQELSNDTPTGCRAHHAAANPGASAAGLAAAAPALAPGQRHREQKRQAENDGGATRGHLGNGIIIKKQLGLRILSWNCNGILHGTRELDLANLVMANDVDVAALSEAEVPASEAQFTLNSFTTFCPLVKTRVMLLVKTDVAVKTNARLANEYLSDDFPSV